MIPCVVRRSLALVIVICTSCTGSGGEPSRNGGGGAVGSGGGPSDSALQSFLAAFTPGSAHEAIPHGVPQSYDWYSHAGFPTLSPPNGETVANWWGQIYVDESGTIVDNVRVEVERTTFLALYNDSDQWVVIQQGPAVGGGAWAEDFHSACSSAEYDVRQEPEGGYSWRTFSGCNAHYWPNQGQSPIKYDKLRAVLVVGFTRLVLGDPSGTDNRGRSSYLNGLGADWRVPGGGCPTPAGSSVPICNGIGGGKFIRVTPDWRTMVMHSMSAADLAALPMPPLGYFQQPDATYFK